MIRGISTSSSFEHTYSKSGVKVISKTKISGETNASFTEYTVLIDGSYLNVTVSSTDISNLYDILTCIRNSREDMRF